MMNEKMEVLMYMIENGYSLGDHDMDFFLDNFSLEELRHWCARFMGEDPRG